MNSLISSVTGQKVSMIFFYKDGFDFKYTRKVDISLNKETTTLFCIRLSSFWITHTQIHTHTHTHIYIYIYIYIRRERGSESKWGGTRGRRHFRKKKMTRYMRCLRNILKSKALLVFVSDVIWIQSSRKPFPHFPWNKTIKYVEYLFSEIYSTTCLPRNKHFSSHLLISARQIWCKI